MGQNTRSQAYTISSATPPREYSDFEARIWPRVADTSPRNSQEGATGKGAKRANTDDDVQHACDSGLEARRCSNGSICHFRLTSRNCELTLREGLMCRSQPSCNRPRPTYSSRDNGRFFLKIYTIARAVLFPPGLISRERVNLLQTKHLRTERSALCCSGHSSIASSSLIQFTVFARGKTRWTSSWVNFCCSSRNGKWPECSNDKSLLRTLDSLGVLPNQRRWAPWIVSSFKEEDRCAEVRAELSKI